MRRRIRKKFLFLNISILFLLLLTIVGISYSYLYSNLKIQGTVKGKLEDTGYFITPDSNPNLTANVAIQNKSIENGLNRFDYILNIKNTGNTILDNFNIIITYNNSIQSPIVEDYDYSLNGKILTITNTKYDINPGQTLSIHFSVLSSSTFVSIYSIKLEALPNATEVAAGKLRVDFMVVSSSSHYIYQYNVTVTNKTNTNITFWKLMIDLPTGTSFVSGSNAIFSTQGSTLIIKSTSSNGKISKNNSVTFNLQLSTNTVNYMPSNIRVFVR
jgi:hypothetical protein